MHYNTAANVEDLSYKDIDAHNEELQQPLDDVYHPAPEPDTAFEGDILPPEPADVTLKHPDDKMDKEPGSNSSTMPSNQVSDSSAENKYQSEMPPASPLLLRELAPHTQDSAFSKHLLIQNTQHYHNKFAAIHKMFSWLHLMTLTELLCIYPRMFPPIAEMHQFQEKLWRNGKLVDIGPIPEYNTNVNTLLVTNLKPLVKEALTGSNQIHWHEAIKAEMDGLESMHIWETMDRPKDTNLVDSKLVLQVKTDVNNVPYKFKARFCMRSFSQKEGIDSNKIFALVVPRDAIWTILTITAKFDWEVDSVDVTQAYLNANLHHDIYLKPPEGAEVPAGKVYKLIKSLYGLKQSGQEWHKELNTHLRRLGFFPLLNVPCIYLRGTGASQVIIAVYVDDMLIVSPQRDQVNQAKKAIIDKWKITDNGPAKEFLKIKITRDWEKRTINLDQHAYIKETVREWIQLHEKTWTPMIHTQSKATHNKEIDNKLKARYLVLVGKLLWILNTI
ncbi:hypothetical protein NDA13_005643 [Ustilago tritici]|nr:hypothetical protein NDA13_005643 [Ustilago tritici]